MTITAQSTTGKRAASAERPSNCRSRRTNRPLETGIGAKSARGRRLVDLIEQFGEALGGLDKLDRQRLDDVRRAAELTLLSELTRADVLRHGGADGDLQTLVRLEGAADRAVRRLHLKPGGQSAIVPSLAEYLAASASPAADDEPAEIEPARELPHEPERTGDDASVNGAVQP